MDGRWRNSAGLCANDKCRICSSGGRGARQMPSSRCCWVFDLMLMAGASLGTRTTDWLVGLEDTVGVDLGAAADAPESSGATSTAALLSELQLKLAQLPKTVFPETSDSVSEGAPTKSPPFELVSPPTVVVVSPAPPPFPVVPVLNVKEAGCSNAAARSVLAPLLPTSGPQSIGSNKLKSSSLSNRSTSLTFNFATMLLSLAAPSLFKLTWVWYSLTQ
mmetsp:Transcript_6359/g.15740  ORF Transcript_6359/g.15740 Transcript_6359/m.15740 type:complete len:218 (+) Transcript_6359:1675-2328(+)